MTIENLTIPVFLVAAMHKARNGGLTYRSCNRHNVQDENLKATQIQ